MTARPAGVLASQPSGPASSAGTVRQLTVWPVKSMSGGREVDAVPAARRGLAGDRAFALVDRRPLRDGKVLSARNVPGILRWTVEDVVDDEPLLRAPDGRSWAWSDDGLRAVLSDDLAVPVDLAGPGAYADLVDSVLVTTRATHAAVEAGFGRCLDPRRWRTNVLLDLPLPAFAENAWEGRALVVGEVVMRLLHPCRRCTIPTWEPGGRSRTAELLRWFHREADGIFGINARVEVPGTLRVGDRVELL